MLAFTRYSLARQFLVISLLILLAGMFLIGAWVSRQIETAVLNRTAAITALYVDSFVSPSLQSLRDGDRLRPEELAELDRLLVDTTLGQQIVSFKIWSPEGRIIYNPAPELIGRVYQVGAGLSEALNGSVRTALSDLQDPENEFERQLWDRLIETYAPVRAAGSHEIVAVSEFYQLPDDLASEVQAARLRSWLVVGAATLAMYLLLASIVGRASNTILAQQEVLENQLRQLWGLLNSNRQLHDKVRRAAARTTALNERFLRRISADLHDGPAQDLALALMRIEPMHEHCASCIGAPDLEAQLGNLRTIHTAIASARDELRAISSGLRLPELTHLSTVEVVQRAVRDYQRKTSQSVSLDVGDLQADTPMPVKITLFRVLQEALANGFEHAQGAEQRVRVWQADDSLFAEISDNGAGFEPDVADRDGRLGLVGMRERVEMLGGGFTIQTAPGKGAKISAAIPLGRGDEELV